MLNSLLSLTSLTLVSLFLCSKSEGGDKCPPLTSHKLDITCIRRKYPVSCDKSVSGNTTAHFRCKSWTKIVNQPEYDQIVCNNGKWDRPLKDDFCEIECGKASWDLNTPKQQNKGTKFNPFPWHAVIYEFNNQTRSVEYKCGGTLISNKVVATSRNCFSGSDDWSSLKVAVGKRYAAFSASDHKTSQIRDVAAIRIDHWNSIALIQLESEVVFTYAVRPICLKLQHKHREPGTALTVSGHISGYDAGCNGDNKGIIKTTDGDLPCVVTDGPIYCALNNTIGCPQFTGGGLVTKDPTSNSYFLDAIISYWQDTGIMFVQAEYVAPYVAKHKYLNKDQTCEAINPNKFASLEIQCAKGNKTVDCNRRLPFGATVKFRCKTYSTIQVAPQSYDKITCSVNGQWDKPIVENFCSSSCGISLSDSDQPVMSNGTKYSPFPWHAGIYERDPADKDYKYICGGTIISNRVVITAASCVMNFYGYYRQYKKKEEWTIKVAVGKFYRTLNDTRDNEAQISDIESMDVPPGFKRPQYPYTEDDIAVLILTQDIVYTYAIRRVCLDLKDSNFEAVQLAKAPGKVLGWGHPVNCEEHNDELHLSEMTYHSDGDRCHERRDKQICGKMMQEGGMCRGYQGGGLVFKDANTNIYYLRGVLSTFSSQFAVSAKLSGYRSYIEGALSMETCPPVTSKKLTMTCTKGKEVLSCEDPQPNRAQVTFHCNNQTTFQVKPQLYSVITCKNGQWSQPLIDDFCLEDCGRLASAADLPPGVDQKLFRYPWHAGIYQTEGVLSDLTCTGSLVSDRVVVTAAQCFADKVTGRKSVEVEKNFQVGLGKYYQDLKDKRDGYQQVHDIKTIKIADKYHGLSSRLANDIAIIILSKPAKISHAVRPICVTTGDEDLPAGAITEFTGWGLSFELSGHLRWTNLSYVPRQECLEKSASRSRKYITDDKVCTASAERTVITCPEDNGGGLAYHKDGRHYLWGVLSTTEDECIGHRFGLFTRASKHKELIEFSADCKMPPQPANGYYTVDSTNRTAKVLKFQCSPGFNIVGQDTVRCKDGFWTPEPPTCSDGCPPLSSIKLKLKCSLEGRPISCNSTLKRGTKVTFQCWGPAYKRTVPVSYRHITCVEGKWSRPLPEDSCTAVCGVIASKEAVPVIGNGYEPDYGEFPWHAAIYQYMGRRWRLVCGGSIISPRVIITAAHCLTEDRDQHKVDKSPSSFIIGLGKRYTDLDAAEDKDHAQFRNVSLVVTPEGYAGSTLFYSEDYGFLVLKDPVSYNAYVGPVCIDVDEDNFEAEQLVPGSMGKVPGYGLTENGTVSTVLKAAEMPYLSPAVCKKSIDYSLKSHVIDDKFCAGNKSSDATVCKGDSGGGLVFYHQQTNAYFLRGIVSQGAKGCSTREYGIFTKVSKYAKAVNCFVHAENSELNDINGPECKE